MLNLTPIRAHLKKYLQLYQIIFIPLIFSIMPIALRDKVITNFEFEFKKTKNLLSKFKRSHIVVLCYC
jgi:hypothetical protein